MTPAARDELAAILAELPMAEVCRILELIGRAMLRAGFDVETVVNELRTITLRHVCRLAFAEVAGTA